MNIIIPIAQPKILQRVIIALAVCVVVVFSILFFIIVSMQGNAIAVSDQVIDMSNVISIYDVRISHPGGGRIILSRHGITDGLDWIGMSRWLAPGHYTGVRIELRPMNETISNGEQKEITVQSGDVLYAMLYKANEDAADTSSDLKNLLFDKNRRSVIQRFTIL
jgi:hypothetical protein